MVESFKAFILEKQLCAEDDGILLAVSGGVDSILMTHLFKKLEYRCAIAHCNFQLRGEESNGDEAFVRGIAAEFDMPVYVERFDTETIAEKEGVSIQMVARKLRYNWFSELLNQTELDYIATAHNLNDSIETVLLNLSRGTGIRGQTGIPSRNDRIIRPLLNITRHEILEYCRDNRIRFREDSSNSDTKYRRNKIRHQILPAFQEINPNFLTTMQENILRNSEIVEIFSKAVDETRKRIFKKAGNQFEISIAEISRLQPLTTWLYELFSPFGFTRLQCSDIQNLFTTSTGKRFISTTHRLFKDRDQLILIPVPEQQFDRYYIDESRSDIFLPFPMDIEVLSREELDKIPDDPNTACLDYDKIQFPLTVRHWLHGDYFVPLGMEQLKKVSDFYIDEKVPLPMKDQIWILASGNKILWIIGYRIDNRFKISQKTQQILILRTYSVES